MSVYGKRVIQSRNILKKSETFTKPKEEKKETAAAAGGKPVMDAEKCVYCTLCAKKCPQESDPCGRYVEAGRGKVRGMRNLRGGLPEESDRAERVSEESVLMEYIE